MGSPSTLGPDVVVAADGGGFAAAARRPIEGARPVGKFLIAAGRRVDFEVVPIWLNGAPGARIEIDRQIDTAMSLTVESGLITRIFAIRNPHKLAGLDQVAALSRT